MPVRRSRPLPSSTHYNIFSNDPTKQRIALAELHRMMAAEAADEERELVAKASATELRARFNLDEKLKPMPAYLREAWNEDAERMVLSTFVNQGLRTD